jgi:hypothetical protein
VAGFLVVLPGDSFAFLAAPLKAKMENDKPIPYGNSFFCLHIFFDLNILKFENKKTCSF